MSSYTEWLASLFHPLHMFQSATTFYPDVVSSLYLPLLLHQTSQLRSQLIPCFFPIWMVQLFWDISTILSLIFFHDPEEQEVLNDLTAWWNGCMLCSSRSSAFLRTWSVELEATIHAFTLLVALLCWRSVSVGRLLLFDQPALCLYSATKWLPIIRENIT